MKAIVIFLSMILLMLNVAPIQSFAQSPCNSSEPGIECYLSNFNKIYSTNYDKFWDIYYHFANRAKQCKAPSVTAEFLRIGTVIGGNAEVQESFAEDAELLLFSNPECYFDGALMLDGDSLKFLKNYWHLSFTGQQEKLIAILKKYSKYKKYNYLLMEYSN